MRAVCLLLMVGFSTTKVNAGILSFGLDNLEANARESLLPGLTALEQLNTTITETRAKLKGIGPWGIDFVACSNLSMKLDYGERLVFAFGLILFDADNDLNRIIACPGTKTTLECVSYVIDRLPDFAEKYKKMVVCFFDDSVLTVKGIKYFFKKCIGKGSDSELAPTPNPNDVEKCNGIYV